MQTLFNKFPFNLKQIGEIKEDEIFTVDGPVCKTCHQPRFVKLEENVVVRALCSCQQKQLAIEQEKQRIAECLEKFKNSACKLMGNKYFNCDFKTAVKNQYNQQLYTSLENYAKNAERVREENIGLYIWGTNSTGKTHAIACLCKALIEKGYTCQFVSMQTILSDIQASFSGLGETESATMYRLARADFLFLDDLGKEFLGREYNANQSKWAEKILLEVLNVRANNKLPVIFTSNYTIQNLETKLKLDKAIIERIMVMSTKIFNLEGCNFRRAERNNKKQLLEELGI